MSKKSMIAPSRVGLLHAKLNIHPDQKIPLSELRKAVQSSSPALRKEAQFAINMGHGRKE